jgi:hypothetical protein
VAFAWSRSLLSTATVGVVEERIGVALGVGVVVALQCWREEQMHVRRSNARQRENGKSLGEHVERIDVDRNDRNEGLCLSETGVRGEERTGPLKLKCNKGVSKKLLVMGGPTMREQSVDG